MRRLKLLFSLLLVSSLIGTLTLFFRYQQQNPAPAVNRHKPLAAATDLTIRERDPKNGCSYVLHASLAQLQDQQYAICSNATITMQQDAHTTGTLQIALAKVDRTKHMIYCSENITGTLQNMAFKTTACIYSLTSHQLEIPVPFELISPTMKTTAPQATIDVKAGRIVCNNGIKTELYLSKRTTSNSRR